MKRAIFFGAMIVALLGGCRGDYASRCENPERYADSGEIPPVRVPDDLDVPSQDQALRIPPGGQLPPPEPDSHRGPCLESPPDYFEGAATAEGGAAPASSEGSQTPQ